MSELTTAEKQRRVREVVDAFGMTASGTGRPVDAARVFDLFQEFMVGYLSLDEFGAALAELGDLYELDVEVSAEQWDPP